MVTNLNHLSLGKVRITFRDGHKVTAMLRDNDHVAQVLRIEVGDGFFAQVGYEDVQYATVPLNQ